MASEDIKIALLRLIEAKSPRDSPALASQLGCDHETVVGAIRSIQSFGAVIDVKAETKEEWALTKEAEAVVQDGSFEARVLALIPKDGISQPALQALPAFAKLGKEANFGVGTATKLKWIKPSKEGDTVVYQRLVGAVEDSLQQQLIKLKADPSAAGFGAKDLNGLKKRKLLEKRTYNVYTVSRGSEFTTTLVKGDSDMTEDMLLDGSWKTRKYKSFNLDALGVAPGGGTLHPLLKVREEYRQVFLEMGFEEMPTNRFVESSFWNFDALFQPQQHPARDAHDTFFMSDPQRSTDFPPEYLERVKTVHQDGGYGSQGYRYDWKIEEAQKNLLRTHTTAVSARMLYKLAQQKPFKPVKYFSIDRVFRNETLDATHLAEFHQIEGVIADYNLTLGDLMGTLSAFFERLGIENLRFKPAYNPYTEPSMEVFSYHAGLDKVVEIGNSGIFRPEMLQPMGLPEDVVVIAWGLSLERPTMIKYGYSNIRDLFGPKVDLAAAKDKPLVRI